MSTKLGEIAPLVDQMETLVENLCQNASVQRQAGLREEVAEIKTHLEDSSEAISSKVAELQEADTKWTEFYAQINVFSDWLDQKETDLEGVKELMDDPKEQYQCAQVCMFAVNLP